jgi:hypothetical protein
MCWYKKDKMRPVKLREISTAREELLRRYLSAGGGYCHVALIKGKFLGVLWKVSNKFLGRSVWGVN